MTAGRFIAVVGPSGVGKDSVMAGLGDAVPELRVVRRVITRAPDLGGEAYDAVSVPTFEAMAARGAFALDWEAHGLRYAIPSSVNAHLAEGTDCLANLSRRALSDAAAMFDRFVVLHITATPETLARRLSARGRESPEEIAARLARAAPLPDGLEVIHVPNDGPLPETVARAAARLLPARV